MAEPGQRRLGELLVARGTLTEAGLAAVLAEQQRTGQLLGELVVALGLATSSAVAAALAEQHGWAKPGGGSSFDPTAAASAASESPPARPPGDERSQPLPPRTSEDSAAAAVHEPSSLQLLPPISVEIETESTTTPRSGEPQPGSADREPGTPLLQPSGSQHAQSGALDMLVPVQGVQESPARLQELRRTRDAELAEARARIAADAAEIERLGNALNDQTTTGQRSADELASARANAMQLERELASARDARQADAAEAVTLRQQAAAELAALRTELARAKSELEVAHAALETSTLELEAVRHELQHQHPRRKSAEHLDSDRHLLFLPTARGYHLLEQAGAAPEPGTRVEVAVPGGPATYLVVKTTASPLPASRMLCAYLVRL